MTASRYGAHVTPIWRATRTIVEQSNACSRISIDLPRASSASIARPKRPPRQSAELAVCGFRALIGAALISDHGTDDVAKALSDN